MINEKMKNDLVALGIKSDDTILMHSSLSSLGYVEGGADTVIDTLLDILTDGTLLIPTLSYATVTADSPVFSIKDTPSCVGKIGNVFREREGVIRSMHPTHSVAAYGKYAKEITATHGHTHKRFGNLGDTPFSADSPFAKMYDLNARVVTLGCGALYITYRHYAEYLYMEKELRSIEKHPDYQKMKDELWAFGKKGVWPHTYNIVSADIMRDMGLLYSSTCGNAELLCVPVKEFVDMLVEKLENYDPVVLWRNEMWDTDAWIKWTVRARQMREELSK